MIVHHFSAMCQYGLHRVDVSVLPGGPEDLAGNKNTKRGLALATVTGGEMRVMKGSKGVS